MSVSSSPKWWPTEGEEPDPRWTLANERTFLAYNRTALAYLVAGLAVAGSWQIADTSLAFAFLGLPLMVIGSVAAWSGRTRFVAAQRAMRVGEPLDAPVVGTLLSIAVLVVSIVGILVVALEFAAR